MPLAAARRHLGIVAGLLAAAALAWVWTANRMAGMDAGPGTDLGTIGWFTASWLAMMAAMMLPSFAPTVAAYVALARERDTGGWPLLAAGYLAVWAVAGLAAYGVFELGKVVAGDALAWYRAGRWLSVGVLVAAAVYEFVPIKQACLRRCRGEHGDVRHTSSQRYWRHSVGIGVRSGGWCIGCSWALMAALFALGVMSLTWMALIAALVTLEKLGPWPVAARLMTAAVLAALAVGIIVAPHDVPGLVVPGSGGMPAMKAMS